MLTWASPVFILQFALAPIYVPFIFGDKWIPAITALQVSVVLAFFEATFYVPHSEALTARGSVQANAYWRIFESLAVGVVLFFVARLGPTAIAIGILLVRVGLLPFYLLSTRSQIKINFGNLFRNVLPTLILAGSGWGVLTLLINFRDQLNLITLGLLLLACSVIWVAFGLRYVPETKKMVIEIFNLINTISKNSKYRVLALIGK